MINFQLNTLLKRTPLNEEDIYNIHTIFNVLSEEKKIHILNNWEKYLAKILQEKNYIQTENNEKIADLLAQANTLLDGTILRAKEKYHKKNETKNQIKKELEASVAFEQMEKQRKIKDICKKI